MTLNLLRLLHQNVHLLQHDCAQPRCTVGSGCFSLPCGCMLFLKHSHAASVPVPVCSGGTSWHRRPAAWHGKARSFWLAALLQWLSSERGLRIHPNVIPLSGVNNPRQTHTSCVSRTLSVRSISLNPYSCDPWGCSVQGKADTLSVCVLPNLRGKAEACSGDII